MKASLSLQNNNNKTSISKDPRARNKLVTGQETRSGRHGAERTHPIAKGWSGHPCQGTSQVVKNRDWVGDIASAQKLDAVAQGRGDRGVGNTPESDPSDCWHGGALD